MSTASEARAETVSPTFEIDDDGIGWLTFADPERALNVLTEGVMKRLGSALDEARGAGREGRVRAVVIRSGKESGFIAGADVEAIAEIEDPEAAENKVRMGQAVFADVASLPVPTVAAIHGICLGGGLELSLACTHRVASDDPRTRLGLPEVMLGILPAWGGTSRLPRLVGLQAALDLLLTGKQADAHKARRIGLVDEVFPADLFDDLARRYALDVAAGVRSPGRARKRLLQRLLDDTPPGRSLVLRTARKKVLESTGGDYPAPLHILDLLEEHLGGSVEDSLAAEARAAGELIVSPECKGLIHVFRMREAARKGNGVDDAEVTGRPVDRIGILGAGVMGGGIAQLAGYHGLSAHMKDIEHEAVSGGLEHARMLFDKAVANRKQSRSEATRAMERISGGVDYHGLSTCQVVVEAVVERMDVKRDVLAETEKWVEDDCVLATNTSSLSVADMAEALDRPERFCGMHFFNPVHRMPLVEIVRGPETSDEAVATIYRLALSLDKVPVVVGDGPGFLVNRILGPYLNEGGFLLGEGLDVEAIDRVAKTFGMPMGPLRLVDEVGIDVSRHAGEALHDALGARLEPSPALERIGASTRTGRKGGRGFYRYENGKEEGVDASVYGDLGLPAPDDARGGSEPDETEIRHRLLLPMVNEAARVLEEGIVSSAADVDLGMVMGTGFPPFRGGLLRFADSVHPRAVLDRLRELEEAHGHRFTPATSIVELASDDRTFYEAYPGTGS
ncbi:MAG: 3-hydroxyacyl-CoA dehydrogenase NAD-binding domain-containing protein [Gemmatimonadota bacterium]|nr:3-hydroxyacyl-CoA dehydrogenase NAD-binding domain-containing protein [Gemmatimonadota bacterium]